MAEIVNFPGITRNDISADRVLGEATRDNLKSVVIIGIDKAGNRYFKSSIADGGDVMWLLETTKRDLLDVEKELSEGPDLPPPDGAA